MRLLHNVKYLGWLAGQIVLAAGAVIIDAPRRTTKLDPTIVAYPLRVTSPQAIGAFTTSITVTPGTLSLGLLVAGDPLPADVARIPGPHEPVPVEHHEPVAVEGQAPVALEGHEPITVEGTDGTPRNSRPGRVLLVHAVFGTDPAAVMADLADMEERLDPSVTQRTHPVDPHGAYARMFTIDPAPNTAPLPHSPRGAGNAQSADTPQPSGDSTSIAGERPHTAPTSSDVRKDLP